MNRMNLSAIALAVLVAGPAWAETDSDNMTLEQERDQMGRQLEENREDIGRDITESRRPSSEMDSTAPGRGLNDGLPNRNRGNAIPGTAEPSQPGEPGTMNPGPGSSLPGTDNTPGSTVTPGTPTTGPGSSTVTPGAPTTTSPTAPGGGYRDGTGGGTGSGTGGTGGGAGGAGGGGS